MGDQSARSPSCAKEHISSVLEICSVRTNGEQASPAIA